MLDAYKPQNNVRKAKPEASTRRCHRCRSSGMCPCRTCGGSGKVFAGADRAGRPSFRTCQGCSGRKMMRCTTCNGAQFI